MPDRIGKVVRKKVRIRGVLHLEEWKLVKRYTWQASSSRDQRRTHTKSDR